MSYDPGVDVERLEPAEAPHPPAIDTPVTVPLPGLSGTNTIMDPDFSAILGDLDIPEGVEPSFLTALPEDMRAEVIEEQRHLVTVGLMIADMEQEINCPDDIQDTLQKAGDVESNPGPQPRYDVFKT